MLGIQALGIQAGNRWKRTSQKDQRSNEEEVSNLSLGLS